ncbi:hypothetical protein BS47DRAFT_411397 [Hydnum rufescens UP504]|uniref:Uncharacterized protein n=1 Tax=Hydnum rufescens UP504 TaxID=1448309 RepID=A0A9P6BBC0_9AGAM|nr:hypothetical protein BS47DRAFT_411397 [Hydnum rufescens UP504]
MLIIKEGFKALPTTKSNYALVVGTRGAKNCQPLRFQVRCLAISLVTTLSFPSPAHSKGQRPLRTQTTRLGRFWAFRPFRPQPHTVYAYPQHKYSIGLIQMNPRNDSSDPNAFRRVYMKHYKAYLSECSISFPLVSLSRHLFCLQRALHPFSPLHTTPPGCPCSMKTGDVQMFRALLHAWSQMRIITGSGCRSPRA